MSIWIDVGDLPDEVVEAGLPGPPDVHPGPLPDRVEPFEDLDVGAGVALGLGHLCGCRGDALNLGLVGVSRVSADQVGG